MLFTRFCDMYTKAVHRLMLVLGLALIFAVTMQVLGRYVPFIPRFLWTLELSNFSLIWLVFLGSIVGVRENRHFNVDLFQGRMLAPPVSIFLKLVYYVTVGTVTYVFLFEGFDYFLKWGLIQSSDITGINLGILYFSVPFAGFSWALFLLENILTDLTGLKKPQRSNTL